MLKQLWINGSNFSLYDYSIIYLVVSVQDLWVGVDLCVCVLDCIKYAIGGEAVRVGVNR